MAQTTYGSITIVDITDAGSLSVYPTSNLPLSIIYDPNNGSGGSYTPNWGTTSLELNPVIYYNNTTLVPSEILTDPNNSIVWKRREGIGNITNLTAGETVTNGKLVVNQSKFDATSASCPSMITYIVTVTYKDPYVDVALTAEGQITFSLVKLASTAKTCSIVGDTVYKYDSEQHVTPANGNIVLTAIYSGVSLSQWQYKHPSTGNWTKFPNSTNSTTFTINETTHSAMFTEDGVLNVKLTTSDANVYDLHTIVKLRDGVKGSDTITAVLTNEDQMVAVPTTGSIDYSQATSRIIIYNAGAVDTDNWNIELSPASGSASGITYTASQTVAANDTVSVTSITGDSRSITFTCTDTRGQYAQIIKTFSIVKIAKGADGHDPTIYSLECDGVAINATNAHANNVNQTNAITYTPSSLWVRAYSQTGNQAKVSYSGRIVITSGNTSIHDVDVDESSFQITSTEMASAKANGYMTVSLYASGGKNTLLDTQTIVITSDGAKGATGQDGEAGADAINVILGNQADIIPCASNNKTLSSVPIDIPFVAYKGTTQVPCSVAGTVTILGKTATVSNATAQAVGHITCTIGANTTITNPTGTVSITFSCEGKTIVHTYRWTRSTAGANGVNAILFEVYTIGGNVFTSRESQDITMYGRLMDGSTEATSSVTDWKWYVYDPEEGTQGGYKLIAGQGTSPAVAGTSELTVNNSSVQSYASYKVTCNYNNSATPYTAYYVLLDKLDPIQAQIFSSIGNQIVNKQGVGAFYVVVTDTGTGMEVDPLKSDRFLTADPSGGTKDDFYYLLDSVNKTVTLRKHNGSGWGNASTSDLPKGSYTWSYRDVNGNPTVPTGIATSGKVIYIDSSFVTKKLTADVKVDI